MSQTNQPEAAQRRLELELIRVRAEAAAVRLEARAAEIELMLLGSLTADGTLPEGTAPAGTAAVRRETAETECGGPDGSLPHAFSLPVNRSNSPDSSAGPIADFVSADCPTEVAEALLRAIRQLLDGRRVDSDWPTTTDAQPPTEPQHGLLPNQPRQEPPRQEQRVQERTSDRELADFLARQSTVQVDSGGESKTQRGMQDRLLGKRRTSEERSTEKPVTSVATAERGEPSVTRAKTGAERESKPKSQAIAVDAAVLDRRISATDAAIPIAVAADESRPIGDKRRRPAVWLASTLAHAGVLLALGLMTLANPLPRDQLAFSASTAEASDEPIETFTIETSEAIVEESLPEPSEAVLDISPLGDLAIAEVTLDLPSTAPPPLAAAIRESFTSSTKRLSAAPSSKPPNRVQFAGIDGGGNHFAYLVDSSKSMKNFDEARLELLRSIDSLQPDHRFYVVFYDQTPEPMRLTDPDRDEPRSVLATREHKLALRRWAMSIGQQRGKSPTEVLPMVFALRPDVIFLLSDGQFSARTEEVIREHNRVENLFGDSRPRSIIHTIRYPGTSKAEAQQAEVQMRRIAAENGGQYRNVEIP